MSEACTVVIGAHQHLDAMRERAGSESKVLTFDENEAVGALEAVMLYRGAHQPDQSGSRWIGMAPGARPDSVWPAAPKRK